MPVTRALLRSPECSWWAELLREMGRSAPGTFYSIKINLHEALVCWEDPGLLRRVSPGMGETVDPEALVRSGDAPGARPQARRAGDLGGWTDPPLLLVLDEVTKVCPLPQMPAGHRLRLPGGSCPSTPSSPWRTAKRPWATAAAGP